MAASRFSSGNSHGSGGMDIGGGEGAGVGAGAGAAQATINPVTNATIIAKTSVILFFIFHSTKIYKPALSKSALLNAIPFVHY